MMENLSNMGTIKDELRRDVVKVIRNRVIGGKLKDVLLNEKYKEVMTDDMMLWVLNQIVATHREDVSYCFSLFREPSELVCMEACKFDGNCIKYIKNPSEELCLVAVKTTGKAIQYIENPSEMVCLEACKHDGFALAHINNPTYEMCLEAVRNTGDAIQFVDVLTEELCLEGCKSDGLALKYIKNPTEEMCLEACKADGYSLRYIKNPTEEMCLEGVKSNWLGIKFIRGASEEVCLEAIKSSGKALNYIENPSSDVCLEGVKSDGSVISEFVGLTDDVYLLAVKSNGLAIRYIENPSKEVCLEACKSNGYALEYIKRSSYDMCLNAVRSQGCSIKLIKNPTEELCLEAVKSDWRAIEFISSPTKEVCTVACKGSYHAAQYIKDMGMREEMCKVNGDCVYYCNTGKQSVEMDAVRQNGLSLRFIMNKSDSLCEEAIKNNPNAIKYVSKPTYFMRELATKTSLGINGKLCERRLSDSELVMFTNLLVDLKRVIIFMNKFVDYFYLYEDNGVIYLKLSDGSVFRYYNGYISSSNSVVMSTACLNKVRDCIVKTIGSLVSTVPLPVKSIRCNTLRGNHTMGTVTNSFIEDGSVDVVLY